MSKDAPVSIVGSLGADPELRYTPSGAIIVNFSVACRETQRDGNGGYEDAEASWFDVKAFGTMAENVAETLARGSRVVVTGTLKQEKWETDNGDKRSKVVILADNVGPDLRWASAVVEKNEKKGSGGGQRNQGGQRQGGQQRSAPANPYADNPYGEEPF